MGWRMAERPGMCQHMLDKTERSAPRMSAAWREKQLGYTLLPLAAGEPVYETKAVGGLVKREVLVMTPAPPEGWAMVTGTG